MKNFDALMVIEKIYLGGGYFCHEMFKDGRLAATKQNLEAMKFSGETFLDLDRIAGGSLNTSESGKKFWTIIDSAGWRTNNQKDARGKFLIPWNYMGGELYEQLAGLLAEIFKPYYNSLCKKYLSAKSLEIINTSDQLIFNFLYACFNGPGWFKYFSDAMNVYVDKQGIIDPAILMNKMIEERKTNAYPFQQKDGSIKYIHIPLIKQGGDIIEGLVQKGII